MEALVLGGGECRRCVVNFRKVLWLFVSEPEIGVSVWDLYRELQCGNSLGGASLWKFIRKIFTIEIH